MDKEREDFDKWYKEKPKGWLGGVKYNTARKAWQAAKAQAVIGQPTQFNLDEFLEMEQKIDSKDGVIAADLDRFIAYAEMVLEKAKALKEPK